MFPAIGIIPKMTVREKISQIIMVKYPRMREVLSSHFQEINECGELGGIFLCYPSIWDAEQSKKLCFDIQRRNKNNRFNIPFFIAVQQQGGLVNNLQMGNVHLPALPSLDFSSDPDAAEKMGYFAAMQALSSGANINFAPSLNLAGNEFLRENDHSISSCPKTAAELGSQFIKGANRAGIISCATGLPRLSSANSIAAETFVSDPERYLRTSGIYPLIRAVESGLPAIMINSDLIVGDSPYEDAFACLIYHIRQDLGFKGLIFTDELAGPSSESARKKIIAALNGGVNQIILNRAFGWVPDFVEDSIARGLIKEDSLDRAVAKVLEYKARYDIGRTVSPEADAEEVRSFADGVGRSAVRKLKRCSDRIKLDGSCRLSIVMVNPARICELDTHHRHPISIKNIIVERKYSENVREVFLPIDPTGMDILGLSEVSESSDYLLFCSHNGFEFDRQFDFLKSQATIGSLRTIGVATRSPLDAHYLGRFCDEVFVLNGYCRSNFEALVDVIFNGEDDFAIKEPSRDLTKMNLKYTCDRNEFFTYLEKW